MSSATLIEATEVVEEPFPGLSIHKFAIWLFLASEIMFFAGLIVTYIAIRFNNPSWPVASELLAVPLVALNTFILIISSLAMVLAFDDLEHGGKRYPRLLLVTVVLGVIFLGIQAYEWSQLLGEGIQLSSNLFGATFYTLTGFHGLHVTGGVIWVLYVTIKAFRGAYAENHDGIELAGLYWHFVDAVWIVLFTIIYLI